MKAEHRKELEKNVLRDRLGKVAEGVKDRSRIIGAVLLGVVVVFLVYMWVSGSSTSKSSALWERLAQTTDARGLEKLAADNRGSLPARTANFELAREMMRQGLQNLASPDNRQSAILQIERARELYTNLISESRDTPILAQEAMLGAARAEEALIGAVDPERGPDALGSVDRAVTAYRKLADSFKDTAQAKLASERAKELEDKRVQIESFYAELNKRANKSK